MFKFSDFAKAATIRAVKTIAQTAASMMTVGGMLTEMDWKTIAGVSLAAGVSSILTSVYAGLPEVGEGLHETESATAPLAELPKGGDAQ